MTSLSDFWAVMHKVTALLNSKSYPDPEPRWLSYFLSFINSIHPCGCQGCSGLEIFLTMTSILEPWYPDMDYFFWDKLIRTSFVLLFFNLPVNAVNWLLHFEKYLRNFIYPFTSESMKSMLSLLFIYYRILLMSRCLFHCQQFTGW